MAAPSRCCPARHLRRPMNCAGLPSRRARSRAQIAVIRLATVVRTSSAQVATVVRTSSAQVATVVRTSSAQVATVVRTSSAQVRIPLVRFSAPVERSIGRYVFPGHVRDAGQKRRSRSSAGFKPARRAGRIASNRHRRVPAMGGAVERQPRSHEVTRGYERAPARAMLRAVGMIDEDFTKPQIGVASSWNTSIASFNTSPPGTARRPAPSTSSTSVPASTRTWCRSVPAGWCCARQQRRHRPEDNVTGRSRFPVGVAAHAIASATAVDAAPPRPPPPVHEQKMVV